MSKKEFDSNEYKVRQRQQWNNVATAWKKWWSTIEKVEQKVSDQLIALADIQLGQHVLDIATGIGEPSITAAHRVGRSGKIVAIDQAPQMLAIAKERANALGLKNIVFQESDTEKLSFPNSSFDAIICRWGFMFLPNLETVLNSIHQMLVPNGKFATAVWDVAEKIPALSFPSQVLQQMFQVPRPSPGTPTLSGLAEGVIENKMIQANFSHIQTKVVTVDFEFPSAQQYAQYIKDCAPTIQVSLSKRSTEEQAEYWQTFETLAQEKYATPNSTILLPSVCICVAGQR